MRFPRWIEVRLAPLRRALVNGRATLPDTAVENGERGYPIESAWREHLAPVIRDMGFKGSGRHFYSVRDEFLLAIRLQSSRAERRFAVNLGVQPLAVPGQLCRPVVPGEFQEIHCVFRKRLTADGNDTWWFFDDDVESKRRAASDAAALLRAEGMPQFQERMRFALTVTPEGIDTAMPIPFLSLALLRQAQGRLDEARAFAALARDKAGAGWRGLTLVEHLLRD